MSEKNNNEKEQDVRSIPTWIRRYAQNRTLPVAVNLLVFLAAFLAIGGLSYLTAWAYVSGQRVLAAASGLVLIAFMLWWLWFSFVGAARFTRRITERLYRAEGEVSVGPAPDQVVGRVSLWVPFLFAFCILASVQLGGMGFIPIRYMQPVSAIYFVPFVCYIGSRSGTTGSPLMLLWPALYALHAILLVAGAPIYFGGSYEALNMLIPTVGYGLIAALAAHIYSRFALRRLRRLATSPETPDQSIEGGRSE